MSDHVNKGNMLFREMLEKLGLNNILLFKKKKTHKSYNSAPSNTTSTCFTLNNKHIGSHDFLLHINANGGFIGVFVQM